MSQWTNPELVVGGLSAGLVGWQNVLKAFIKNEKIAKGILNFGEATRIGNAATRIGKEIHLVGSRARGNANIFSDWDYVIEGINHKSWSKIKNSLPGSKSLLDNTSRNIDLFRGKLDRTKPHITFYPKKL